MRSSNDKGKNAETVKRTEMSGEEPGSEVRTAMARCAVSVSLRPMGFRPSSGAA